jgi:hypothetical protein
MTRGRSFAGGTKLHAYAASEPRSSISSSARAALLIVDSILPRWRMMPASLEVFECAPERLALAQDRQPRQARLEAFEAQLLEQPAVVPDRKAPLAVVIVDVLGCGDAPEAARLAVGTGRETCGHAPG